MNARGRIRPELARLLVLQDAVVSRPQARAAGLSARTIDRFVAEGAWVALLRGVYLTHGGEATLAQLCWAAHLHLGGASAVGGRAALELLGVPGAPAAGPWWRTDSIDLWVPEGSWRVCPPPFRVRRDSAGRLGRRTTALLPTISATDALIDAADGGDVDGFVGLVTAAERARVCTAAEVRGRLRRRPTAPNRAMMMKILGDLTGIESTLEWAYRNEVERAHGLPPGERQAQGIRARHDVRYSRFGLIVELDGRAGHADRPFRDMARDNRHALRGETTLRFGSRDVRGAPCAVAAQVGAALAVRGWSGVPSPCPRCAAAHAAGDDRWWCA